MKIKTTLYIILLAGINLMCQSAPGKISEEDDILSTIFNGNELKSVDKLIDAFDSMVTAETTGSDINAAYQAYFYRNDTSEMGLIEADFSKPENLMKFREAIHELKSNDLFSDFWIVKELTRFTIDIETGDDTRDSIFELDLNLEGRFMQVLKTPIDQNEVFEYYYASLPAQNGISPGLISKMAQADYKEMDFSFKTNRLVWAVHYITVITMMGQEIYIE